RALRPEVGGACAREPIVAAVYFDDREPRGIELQASLRSAYRAGIEAAAREQRGIGPGARADAHRHGMRCSGKGRLYWMNIQFSRPYVTYRRCARPRSLGRIESQPTRGRRVRPG